MRSIEDWNRDEPSPFRAVWLGHVPLRNLLPNALVWPCAAEVLAIFLDYPMKLPVLDNGQMIRAFSPDAL
jgi:hypothetical protein